MIFCLKLIDKYCGFVFKFCNSAPISEDICILSSQFHPILARHLYSKFIIPPHYCKAFVFEVCNSTSVLQDSFSCVSFIDLSSVSDVLKYCIISFEAGIKGNKCALMNAL
jgi:hypothetical protein